MAIGKIVRQLRGTVQGDPSKKRLAVYIGRFQPLHRGHAYVLDHCLDNYDEVLLLIGSAFKARDPKDPFTFEERRKVIRDWYAYTRPERVSDTLAIRPLRDRPYNDAAWTAAVQETVAGFVGSRDVEVTVVGSDRDASTWYLKSFPQWKDDILPPYDNIPGLAATQVREHYFMPEKSVSSITGLLPATHQFLIDFADSPEYKLLCQQSAWLRQYRIDHETGKHPAQHVCADAVVVQSGHVLVQRRAHLWGRGLLTTSGGGFVKPRARIKDTAVEECMQETGILLASGKRAKEITHDMLKGNIVDSEYFDHPDLSLRGRFFVHAFLIRLNDQKPLPKVGAQYIPDEDMGDEDTGKHPDGLESLDSWWMPLHEALEHPERWFEHSYHIIETLFARMKD